MDTFRDAVDGSVFYKVGPLVTRDQDEAMLWLAAETTRDFLLNGEGRRPPLSLPGQQQQQQSRQSRQSRQSSNKKPIRRRRAAAPKVAAASSSWASLSRSTFFLNAERSLGLGTVDNRRTTFAVPSSPATSSFSTPGRKGAAAKGKGGGEGHRDSGYDDKDDEDDDDDDDDEDEDDDDGQKKPSFPMDHPFDRFLHTLVDSRARAGVEKIGHHAFLHRRASSKRFRLRSKSSVDRQEEEEQKWVLG